MTAPPTTPVPAPEGGRPLLGYLPGIDGLRALSVLAVLAYHLDASWATGGYLGVEVFFVVSGFLITSLLLEEHRRSGAVDLVHFWARRARRLLPAVIVLLLAVSAWSAIAHDPGDLVRFRGDAIASLLYVQNWWAIVADQPYFEAFGRPSPFRHLWSLAIEEQFYLFWPVLLPLGLRFLGRRSTALLVALGILSSMATMGALADITAPERAYYGTDARIGGILAGALLAFVWRPRTARSALPRAPRAVVSGLGIAALATLAWQAATRSEFDPWTYPWGFLTVDVATLVVLVAATHPGAGLERVLGAGPLQAIGRRSYSIYLWHWPVIVSTRDQDWGLDGPTALAVRLVLIAVLSECSYRLVERPVREGRVLERLRRVDPGPGVPRAARRRAPALALALAAVTLVVLLGGVLAAAPSATSTDESVLAAGDTDVVIDTTPLRIDIPAPTTSAPTEIAPATTAAPPPTTAPPADAGDAPPATVTDPAWPTAPPITDPNDPQRVIDVTVVGESVTLGAAGTLQRYYGGRIQIDAVEGRRFEEGVEIIEALAAGGRLTPNVVVHLGNNGVAPPGALERVVAAVGPQRRLVLVSVRVPRRWEQQVNSEIYRVVRQHPTVLLADWNQLANTEDGMLTDDGVHLTHAGQQRYRDIIVDQAP